MSKIIYDFDPRNIPAEHLQAIGKVSACWAQTEQLVQWLIAGCLGIDMERGWATTAHMSVPLRDHVARAVAEIAIDDLDALDELDGLLDKIGEAAVKRNNAAHHSWARNPETGAVLRITHSARGSVKVDLVEVTVDEIELDAEFIYHAGMALSGFIDRHGLHPNQPPLRPRGHKTKAARKRRRQAAV